MVSWQVRFKLSSLVVVSVTALSACQAASEGPGDDAAAWDAADPASPIEADAGVPASDGATGADGKTPLNPEDRLDAAVPSGEGGPNSLDTGTPMATGDAGGTTAQVMTPQPTSIVPDGERVIVNKLCELTLLGYQASYQEHVPATVGSDGTVFLATPGPFPVRTKPSTITRCADTGASDWSSAPAVPAGASTNKSILAASDLGGLFYLNGEFTSSAGRIAADGSSVWADNYDGFLRFGLQLGVSQQAPWVYATGSAAQLPMEAPGMSGLPFVVKYDGGGQRVWLKRMPAEQVGRSLAADDNGYFYFSGPKLSGPLGSQEDAGLRVTKLDGEANLVWTREFDRGTTDNYYDTTKLVVSRTGDSIYVLMNGVTPLIEGAAQYGTTGVRLLKLDDEGNAVWYKELVFSHTTTVDPSEGIVWSGLHAMLGNFMMWGMLPRADGSVCLAGQYSNAFVNGARPRLPYTGMLVSCFDQNGGPLWTHQFRVGPLGDPSMEQRHLYFSAFGELPNGDMRFVATSVVARAPTLTVFTISAAGEPL